MTRPKMSPKMQKRIPIVSSLWPSMPRNETWERSGSFRPASPPAVFGVDWARTAVPLNNIRAAQTAPAFANRPRSGRTPARQVRISDPPSRILKQGNSLNLPLNIAFRHTILPWRLFFRGWNGWLTGFATGCLLRLDRCTSFSRSEQTPRPRYRGLETPKSRIRVDTRLIFITWPDQGGQTVRHGGAHLVKPSEPRAPSESGSTGSSTIIAIYAISVGTQLTLG